MPGLACGERKETRLQRFLVQSNMLVNDDQADQAIRYLEEALKLDSCFADALNNLGTIYFNQRAYDLAMNHYDRALACRPGYVDAYLNRANTAYELKEYYKALADLEKVIKAKPDTALAYISQGIVYTRMREFDNALRSFGQARSLDSSSAEVLINIGTVYYYRKQYDSAVNILRTALEMHPGDAAGHAYNTLAMISAARQQYGEAGESLDSALMLAPDDAFFLNNRGYIKLMTGDSEGARADIDRSITIDPYNGWAYRNKGIYYLKAGRAADAIRLLSQAEEMDAFIENIYYYLGQSYMLADDRESACKAFALSGERGEMVNESRAACAEN
jgi:tetratricopeptide (TPR) repeat protein